MRCGKVAFGAGFAVAALLTLALVALQPSATVSAQGYQTKVHGADNGDSLVVERGGQIKFPPFGTAGTGVTLVSDSSEFGLRKVVLKFTNTSITMTDATTAGCHGSRLVWTVPSNKFGTLLGGRMNLTTLAGSGGIADTAALVASLGVSAVGTDNATLTVFESNILGSTSGTLVGGAGTLVSAISALAIYGDVIDDFYLNLAVPDAGSTGNDTITLNGTITLYFLES
jgi:hypothetical protein